MLACACVISEALIIIIGREKVVKTFIILVSKNLKIKTKKGRCSRREKKRERIDQLPHDPMNTFANPWCA